MKLSLQPLFGLGKVVVTLGAAAALAEADTDPASLLARYQHGDWGSLHETDQRDNAYAAEYGSGRIQGRYVLKTGAVIWVTTEADRTVTTVLLPDEW
jgi:hypothetical protein